MTPAHREGWRGKWDAYDATRAPDDAAGAADARRPLPRLPPGKAWMIPWIWLISTGMLVLGGILIVLLIAGFGPRLGV